MPPLAALALALALLLPAWGCRSAGPGFRPTVGVDGSLATDIDGEHELGAGYALVADVLPLAERWSLSVALVDSDFKDSDRRRMRARVARVQLRWHGLVDLSSEYGPEGEHPGYLALGAGHVFDADGASGSDYGDGDYVDVEVGWRHAIDKRGWLVSVGLNMAYANVDEDSGKGNLTTEAVRGALLFGVHWSL